MQNEPRAENKTIKKPFWEDLMYGNIIEEFGAVAFPALHEKYELRKMGKKSVNSLRWFSDVPVLPYPRYKAYPLPSQRRAYVISRTHKWPFSDLFCDADQL